MAVFKNYYQILGIEPFAETDEVKAAYRKLARQFHPDLNDGNRQAEEKFKEINEAYEILGNSEKRAMHDTMLKAMQGLSGSAKKQAQASYGKAGPQASQAEAQKGKRDADSTNSSPPPKAADSAGSAGSESNPKGAKDKGSGNAPSGGIFESFLKKGFSEAGSKGAAADDGIFKKKKATDGKGAPQEPARRGEDVVVKTAISPQEATDGVVKTVNVQHNEICRRCAGTGKVNGALCQACNGEKILVRLKKIDVRIPAGVKSGSRVRVAKEGGRGTGGLENGDLFLHIEVVYDASLRIEGMDVYGEAALSIPDAVLGGEIDVPTLNGVVKMTVPPGTQTGKVFRLKERGVQSGLSKGDHFVTVVVVTPENLSSREKELYHELARLRPEKPVLKKPR